MSKILNTKHLYWELENKYDGYKPTLCGEDSEGPMYCSGSLQYYYGIYSTYDTNLIFEEAAKDFKMSDKDKTYLHKLLTDFSIEKFLNDEQDNDFLNFLFNYNFRIGIIGE